MTANSLGTVADANCPGPDLWESRSVAWNSSATAAGSTGDATWSVEIAVPFASLGVEPPAAGDAWLACLGRIARAVMTDSVNKVVVDLQRVTRADTKILAVLIKVLRRARARQVDLEIDASPLVHDLITTYRVRDLLADGPPKPRHEAHPCRRVS